MVERAYRDMGVENLKYQINRGEISPGKISRSSICNTIGVDVLQGVTNNMGNTFVGVEKILQENVLPRLFLVKS